MTLSIQFRTRQFNRAGYDTNALPTKQPSDCLPRRVFIVRGVERGGQSEGFFTPMIKHPSIQYRDGGIIDLPDSRGFTIDPTAAHDFKADPMAYTAKELGTTSDTLGKWLMHYADQARCTGTNRSGQRCRRMSVTSHPDPIEFIDGQSNRCNHHQTPA
jgi:hypothetical protein